MRCSMPHYEQACIFICSYHCVVFDMVPVSMFLQVMIHEATAFHAVCSCMSTFIFLEKRNCSSKMTVSKDLKKLEN